MSKHHPLYRPSGEAVWTVSCCVMVVRKREKITSWYLTVLFRGYQSRELEVTHGIQPYSTHFWYHVILYVQYIYCLYTVWKWHWAQVIIYSHLSSTCITWHAYANSQYWHTCSLTWDAPVDSPLLHAQWLIIGLSEGLEWLVGRNTFKNTKWYREPSTKPSLTI